MYLTSIENDKEVFMNKKVLRSLSYGVYVISTLDGERHTGCIANSAMQITSSPASIAVSINHDNYTNSCIEKCGRFAISILSESSDPGLIGTFGFHSGKDTDKFSDVKHHVIDGIAVPDDSCGYIVCKVTGKLETSTHTIFLGEMTEGDVLSENAPMTYAYYHNVVKAKSPKDAPTYLPEEDSTTSASGKKWACGICGYVYDGSVPFEELPDSYICPVCKQPKSKFKAV